MSRFRTVPTVVLALGLAVALAAGASAMTSGGAAVRAHSSKYGKVLFDGGGRTLYTFAKDRGKTSTCYGGCASVWPPYIVKSKSAVKALSGVNSRLIGTTLRRDGRLEVTYAGHPLYFFTGDHAPGQINCQGVSNFGGVWYVIHPSGKIVF